MIAPEAVVVSSADFNVSVFGIVIDLTSKITLLLEDSDAFAALSDCIWALVLRIFFFDGVGVKNEISTFDEELI